MDDHDTYLHQQLTQNSSSSAIDLTGTPAGLALSAPPSPSLDPSDSRRSISRRRTSWGQRQVDMGHDPLRLQLASPPSARFSSANIPFGDDPFYSPPDEHAPYTREYPYTTNDVAYGGRLREAQPYMAAQAGTSTASLITPHLEPEMETEDGHREDDEAHLTANMSRSGTEERWGADDPEQTGTTTPRKGRRTLRYSVSPSPLKKTGTVIMSMSQNLRRASLRVVNLAGTGLENQLRLGDGSDDGVRKGTTSDDEPEDVPDLSRALALRGRTLGVFGPDSKTRQTLYNLLLYPCVPPCHFFCSILTGPQMD